MAARNGAWCFACTGTCGGVTNTPWACGDDACERHRLPLVQTPAAYRCPSCLADAPGPGPCASEACGRRGELRHGVALCAVCRGASKTRWTLANPPEADRCYSSVHKGCSKHARSMFGSPQGWSACGETEGGGEGMHGAWAEVDLGEELTVVGVALQTRNNSDQYATAFKVSTSLDGKHYSPVDEGAEFRGCARRNETVAREFAEPAQARHLRVTVVGYNAHCSLRFAALAAPCGAGARALSCSACAPVLDASQLPAVVPATGMAPVYTPLPWDAAPSNGPVAERGSFHDAGRGEFEYGVMVAWCNRRVFWSHVDVNGQCKSRETKRQPS